MLCQKSIDVGNDEALEKVMEIWNENFYHLKRETSWDYTITWVQLKAGNSIVICPAYTGKAVMVEDRETYLSKTQDQIHEGNYELLHFILDTYIIGIVICLKLILLFVISLMFMLYISKRCWITSESKGRFDWSLDIPGVFPNTPLKKSFEMVREWLQNYDTFHLMIN